MIDFTQLRFQPDGLIPAIIQNAETLEVLTLAYMNKESLQRTIETGETWFYSRSRQKLWHKGETSGFIQKVQAIGYDCDQDTLLVKVIPHGPACHTGAISCFSLKGELAESYMTVLERLEKVIANREEVRPEGAYTTYLFTQGIDKILKKLGEESTEVVIAAKNDSVEELRYESADLIFHLLVLLRQRKLPLSDVLKELESRMK